MLRCFIDIAHFRAEIQFFIHHRYSTWKFWVKFKPEWSGSAISLTQSEI